MSRKIDASDPKKLSDDDKRYLQERNRLPAGVYPAPAPDDPRNKGVPVDPNSYPTADASTGYGGMTVEQLKTELENRGLGTGGNKAELVSRLEEDDNSDEEEEDEEEE